MSGHGMHGGQPNPHAHPRFWVPDVTDPNFPPNDIRNAGNKGLNVVYGSHVAWDEKTGKPSFFGAGGDGKQTWIDGEVPFGMYDNINPWRWDDGIKQWVRV